MKICLWILSVVTCASLLLNVIALHKISRLNKIVNHDWAVTTNMESVFESALVKVQDLNSNLLANDTVLQLLMEHETNSWGRFTSALDSLTNSDSMTTTDPATGLPVPKDYQIDPATGLPMSNGASSINPKVLTLSWRIVEANDQWQRWSFQFSIANPSYATTTDAEVEFLDKDGYVLNRKSEYHLSLDSFSTNKFSDYDLVEMPTALNVKTMRIRLK